MNFFSKIPIFIYTGKYLQLASHRKKQARPRH